MNTSKKNNKTAKNIIPGYKFVKALGGSTGAKLYRDSSNNFWVFKGPAKYGDEKQPKYESAANDIYELLKIPSLVKPLQKKKKKLLTGCLNSSIRNHIYIFN